MSNCFNGLGVSRVLVLSLELAAFGCEQSDSALLDGGDDGGSVADSGDGEGADSGANDAGQPDAGQPDAGPTGGGTPCSDSSECEGEYWGLAGTACLNGQCGCTSDADCTVRAGYVCDGGTWTCLPPTGGGMRCIDNTDCGGDFPDDHGPLCLDDHCGCTEDADCSERGQFNLCATGGWSCVPCITDEHCVEKGIGNLCVGNRCIDCQTDADCRDPLSPVCGEYNRCSCTREACAEDDLICYTWFGACRPKCTSDASCVGLDSRPFCDESSGECMRCQVDADCIAHGSGTTCVPPGNCE